MYVKFMEREGWLGRIITIEGNMALVVYTLPFEQEDRYAWFNLGECDDDGSYSVRESDGIPATEDDIDGVSATRFT